MIWITLFVLTVYSSGLVESVRGREDPRCVELNCPDGTTCRVFTRCPNPMTCNLVAECMENPPARSLTGVCRVGDPILIQLRGVVRDTHCGPRLYCPEGTFCNNRVMDTYATCCVSDPDAPEKPGRCPPRRLVPGRQSCLKTCNNDGDCLHSDKCCSTGCGMTCRTARRNRTWERPIPRSRPRPMISPVFSN